MKRLLVVDDELGARESIRAIFSGTYEVLVAASAVEALELLAKTHIDIILLDVVMPGMNGLVFLRAAREIFPDIPVIMISASFSDQAMLEARQLQAIGFICKPFDIHEIRNLVGQTLKAADSSRQQLLLQQELSKKFPVNIIGESPAIRRVMEAVKVASQTNAPILILAESGVGREHLARQIHSWSHRSAEPFVKIEPHQLDAAAMNTELFGCVIETSPSRIKPGAIDLVGRGSIYLNDINRLPTETQQHLVTAILHGEFTRPGLTTQNIPHIARFFATCAPQSISGLIPALAACFAEHTITIPPLRERIEDIPILATHYVGQLRAALNSRTNSIAPEAMHKLQDYSWPGNVRELRNVIERILFLHGEEEIIQTAFLPKEISGELLPSLDLNEISFHQATDQLHRQLIICALRQTGGVIKNAAHLLHVTPRILQHRVDKLHINVRDL